MKKSNNLASVLKSLVNAREACEIIGDGMYSELLHYYVKKGKAPQPIKHGRDYYFDRREIENWVKPAPESTGPRRKYE